MFSRLRVVISAVMCCATVSALQTTTAAATATWQTLNNPIQSTQLTDLPFGDASQWLQPWRSTLTTQPATALLNMIGMNFSGVTPQEANATAELLHDNGFTRVRLEIPWDAMTYGDPSQVSDQSDEALYIQAFKRWDLRPLILLNANSEDPTPTTSTTITLTAPANVGDRTVSLKPTTDSGVVPGLTGFDASDPNGYPEDPGDLITNVAPDGTATLSQPLQTAIPAGSISVKTLSYEPFAPPYLSDGTTPNPRFQATLDGWLTYVKGALSFVKQVYGSDNFDAEVWNELTFGSAFLDESDYFNPVPDPGSTGDVDEAILTATVQALADPANGLSDVKVGDGFSSTVPWTSGTTVPVGTAAIDHHPYAGERQFPDSPDEPGTIEVDAFGDPTSFVPTYTEFFPEYFLTGIQTETLMRDLSPITTLIYGTPHGATTHPVGGTPPANWITEVNLDQTQAATNGMPTSDIQEFQAKTLLRYYLAYGSEGVQALDIYAAAGGGCCQVIPQAFFNAVDQDPSSYPGSLGGQAVQAVANLTSQFAGAVATTSPQQVTLLSIANESSDVQFQGNGTTATPSLTDRDVLAFFPFQKSPGNIIAAVYVMSRDLTRVYTTSPAPGLTQYDQPPEAFRIAIGNVDGPTVKVKSLYDPLTGTFIDDAATIVSHTATSVTVQLPVTDSPRLLDLTGTKLHG
jgi:hypothetical protein